MAPPAMLKGVTSFSVLPLVLAFYAIGGLPPSRCRMPPILTFSDRHGNEIRDAVRDLYHENSARSESDNDSTYSASSSSDDDNFDPDGVDDDDSTDSVVDPPPSIEHPAPGGILFPNAPDAELPAEDDTFLSHSSASSSDDSELAGDTDSDVPSEPPHTPPPAQASHTEVTRPRVPRPHQPVPGRPRQPQE